jgi:phage tail-like protein
VSGNPAFLPPVPQPPHDPRAWRLDVRAGWQPLEPVPGAPAPGTRVSPLDGALVLDPLPGAGRSLFEPSGSLGGLVPPAVVALDGTSAPWLLDRENARILRFDPCTCAFVAAPCIGGRGRGARQVDDAAAIAIACGNLFVADAGNARLHVYALPSLVLRGHWRPPPPAGFRPVAVAIDSHGLVHVGDPDAGKVHVFAANGRWLRAIDGLGPIRQLAFDCADRLYVVVDGATDVVVRSRDGAVEHVLLPEDVADRFAPLPFPVGADGSLVLGELCHAAGCTPEGGGRFDLRGRPVRDPGAAPIESHRAAGSHVTVALDSRIHQCVWDRVELDVTLPAGASVIVRTWTSDNDAPADLVADIDPTKWETQQTVRPGASAGRRTWDCLVRGQPGRFLWLALDLAGDGFDTPRVHSARVLFPRVSLARYLPGVYRAEPLAADFTDRFLAVFDRGFREIEAQIDGQAALFDPMSAPAGDRGDDDFLGWLAGWLGITFSRSWPVERRRRFLKSAGKLFACRGTREGLRQSLLLFLGVDASRCPPCVPACGPCPKPGRAWEPPPLLLEHFQTRRWLYLGAGRLGDAAVLWGRRIVNRSQLDEGARLGASQLITTPDPERDPLLVHANRLTVFLPAKLGRSAVERRAVVNLVRQERPAHAAFGVEWVAPRFRIGVQSMIGYDAVVGCWPEGVALDDARLGRATVLGGPPRPAPTLSVGADARIGATTRLG